MKPTTILLALIIIAVAAPLHAEDPYPSGTVAFFARLQCPAGWTLYEAANGRTVVPMNSNTGSTTGNALADVEKREHQHTESGTVTLPPTSMAAASGPNPNNGSAGTYRIAGTTSSEKANIPYVQLLACRKSSEASRGQLPPALVAFTTSVECASGWNPASFAVGRYLVGLPKDGRPKWSFGGPPLAPGENRTHTHTFSTQVTTNISGLAIVSGCCLDNFAAYGTYPIAATADPSEAGLPYIHLTPCEVNR
ncbi:MAG TPA: hypothetical protein VN380_00270 [Thermoanaerobaculia bacterium]|jgi:hypothetical protein|nr:hypothetical protein [Thermoanaerobaculia bacterium]